MNFYTKFFILYLGMAIGALTASSMFLPLKKESKEKGDTMSLLPFCSSIAEKLPIAGDDNYDWGLLTQSCLDGDRVIYFGVPNEQHN